MGRTHDRLNRGSNPQYASNRLSFENEDDFIERTFELMDIAKESLEIKEKCLSVSLKRIYTLIKFYLRSIKEETEHTGTTISIPLALME